MSPPENALVLAVDEKSQVQALDRTVPILPMMPGTPARATHDYVRHGTTTVFAAMDVLTGAVIARNYRRHRSAEFLRFLKEVDKATPTDLELHLVLDNYATHKTPAVKAWLLKHPRVVLHFTPTSPVLAGPGRTMVHRTHPPQTEALHPPLRHRARTRHRHLDPELEQGPQAVRVDQIRRPDPRNPRQLLPTNQRLKTLDFQLLTEMSFDFYLN
ncbi:hypothetical protein KEM60_02140 [Austwickia sp. TVS 96-490-7B]|nr:hypothetical protein [Austwickia sp. TVS 96-490-7B]